MSGELRAQGAPEAVRGWMSRSRDWLDVVDVDPSWTGALEKFRKIDPGEREAIALATQF